ncbi:hypothetical protein [Endozoicomonas numazuensis]|uniref:Uncharacterized protein n=1 Tax=Endozoicomonas numazuensis TaxID=1137799 RepID=A0A081NKP4_9GAMM|nr:hypothetical protein [Endozoicomonas numazuensis]KEQ19017.1 hypothetical protein GZ78_03000 [Endozoicomonas numazuensis]
MLTCMQGEFTYNAEKDTLYLTRLIEGRNPSLSYTSQPMPSPLPADRQTEGLYLQNACQLLEQGFSIHLFADSQQGTHFALTPPQLEQPSPLVIKKEIQEEKTGYALDKNIPYSFAPTFMSDDLKNSFHFSCKNIQFYERADLVTADCPVNQGKTVRAIAISPRSILFKVIESNTQTKEPVNFFAENRKGRITPRHAEFIPRFITRKVDTATFISEDCKNNQIVVPFMDWKTCHSKNTVTLSDSITVLENTELVVDTRDDKNYALMFYPLRSKFNEPTWLSGVNQCHQNGLVLSYNTYHNHLYCEAPATLTKENTPPKRPALSQERTTLSQLLTDEDEFEVSFIDNLEEEI